MKSALKKTTDILKMGKLWQPESAWRESSKPKLYGGMCDFRRESVGIKLYALHNDECWFSIFKKSYLLLNFIQYNSPHRIECTTYCEHWVFDSTYKIPFTFFPEIRIWLGFWCMKSYMFYFLLFDAPLIIIHDSRMTE